MSNNIYLTSEPIWYKKQMTTTEEWTNDVGNYFNSTIYREIIINKFNIHDMPKIDVIINGNCGYKNVYSCQHTRKNKLSGLETHFETICYGTQMIHDFKQVKPDVSHEIKSITQLYKLWVQLEGKAFTG